MINMKKPIIYNAKDIKPILEEIFNIYTDEDLYKFVEEKYGEFSIAATNGTISYSIDEGDYIIHFVELPEQILIQKWFFVPNSI
jgi:hypothetical protein